MNSSTERTQWAGPHGPIEIAIDMPTASSAASIRGLAVIAHPHPLFGGTLDNKVVQTIARAFVQLGYVTVRPNFRGVGNTAGQHDNGCGEIQDHLWVIAHAQQHILAGALAEKPLALAGFSFGAFVTSHVAQHLAEQGKGAERMVLVGTATSRFEVANVPPDTIVIHGEQDETVPLHTVFDWARPQHLPVIVMPGVEHFFHGKLPQLRDLIIQQYPKHSL
jgi:alpha/beta superfamily hydrolase